MMAFGKTTSVRKRFNFKRLFWVPVVAALATTTSHYGESIVAAPPGGDAVSAVPMAKAAAAAAEAVAAVTPATTEKPKLQTRRLPPAKPAAPEVQTDRGSAAPSTSERVLQRKRASGFSSSGTYGDQAARSNTCPATNLGVLPSSGGSFNTDTTGSTDDFQNDGSPCNSYDDGSPAGQGGPDQIYEFTVDATGLWSFDTCTVPAGWDTSLMIREETGLGCPGDWVACDGDGCNMGSYESRVAANLSAGTTYYLVVDGYGAGDAGAVTVTWENKDLEKCAPIGDDCFTTLCDGKTSYDFASNPLPPNYFYDGSPAFAGKVDLGGPGGFPSDTTVRRLEQMCFPDPLPSTAGPIQVQVTWLDLRSCSAVNVGGQTFDMFVGLALAPPSMGDMTATKEDADGGTFTANLHVEAEIWFVPVGGGPSTATISAPVDLTTTEPIPWLQNDPNLTWCGAQGFFAGFAMGPSGQPCCKQRCHANPNGNHPHCVQPPDCPKCPPPPDPHRTDAGTSVTFGTTDAPEIPPDFFEPGSSAFNGAVNMDPGPSDTEVQRSGEIVCPDPPPEYPHACTPVQIEIIALDLKSAAPITVVAGGSDTLWDVTLDLSDSAQQQGTMTITRTHDNGGTFDSTLPVLPRFTFTKIAGPGIPLGSTVTLDYGTEEELPLQVDFTLVPWVIDLAAHLQGTIDAPNDGNFVPGVEELMPGDPNSQVTVQAVGISQGGGVGHPVIPRALCPLPGDPTGDPCAALQAAHCQGSPNDLCRPTIVQMQNGQPVAIQCDCITPGPKCGPIQINPASGTVSCPGGCPPPNPAGGCVVFVDSNSTGEPEISVTQIPDGSIVTCDCEGGGPEPDPHRTVIGTSVTFGAEDTPSISADFFFAGSDPFNGDVDMEAGPQDTLVQRSGQIVCPAPPSACPTIEIEMVELSLRSSAPITVGPGASEWYVELGLSWTDPGVAGTLDANLDHANGGLFDATVPILPRFVFKRGECHNELGLPTGISCNPLMGDLECQGIDPNWTCEVEMLTLDYGDAGIPPLEINFNGVPWVVSLGSSLVGTIDAPNDGNFVPGVEELIPGDPNSQVVTQADGLSKGGGVGHPVVPPPLLCPLPGDPAIDPCATLQATDCVGSTDELCRPIIVQIQMEQAVAIECDCITPGNKCGPIDIGLGGDTITCPGGCPDPNPPGDCLIFVNGVSSGSATGSAASFPEDAIITCECTGLDQKCEHCGPGSHWVDACPAGTDSFPTGAVVGISTDGDCIVDTNLVFTGPVTVDRGAGIPHQIDTEIVSMNLTNIFDPTVTLTAGAGLGQGGVLDPSLGQIIEQVGDDTAADSTFDVFFEINNGGVYYYNHDPMTVAAKIFCVPPNGLYTHISTCLPLWDLPPSDLNAVEIAKLVTANHKPFPPEQCPTETSAADDPCAALQLLDCEGTTDQICRPIRVVVDNGLPVATECDCITPGNKCGPIQIVGASVFCPGGCPAPNPPGTCLVYADGVSTGVDYMPTSDFADGTVLTCECPAFDQKCEHCGPGPDWVDSCPAGTDIFPSGAVVGLDTDFDANCTVDTNLVLFGPVQVDRQAAVGGTIDTEIVSMVLTGGGMTLTAGAGLGQGGVLPASPGQIIEQVADNTAADSFFDVFFEIDAGGGTYYYNQAPLTVQAKIFCVPPNRMYSHISGCIDLYDSPTGGNLVARLVTANHQPFPGEMCPLPSDPPDPSDPCAVLQMSDCPGSPDDLCRPRAVEIWGVCLNDPIIPCSSDADCPAGDVCVPSEAVAVLCDCFTPGPGGGPGACGPIDISVDGATVSCPGDCSPLPDPCLLFADGDSTGLQSASITLFPVGTLLTCECESVEQPEACCFPDGTCQDLPPSQCRGQDGAPRGAGTACQGDTDGNGIDDACEFDSKCGDCGPGDHWIDGCLAGHDRMPSGAVVGLDMDLDCVVDRNLVLFGPVEIAREAGDAVIHTIQTEMVALSLTGGGITLRAGGGGGAGGNLAATVGAIVEKADPATAQSYFDVFFEVDDGSGVYLYNHDPFTVEAQIVCVPPNGIYSHLTGCIPLYDDPIGGTVIANLVTADHDPFGDELCPLPDTDPVFPCIKRQIFDCQGTPAELCLPRVFEIQGVCVGDPAIPCTSDADCPNVDTCVPDQASAVLCDCFGTDPACGPVDISPDGTTLSCPGTCQPPDPAGPCLIFVDGVSTGQPSILVQNVPAGSQVTCDCERKCAPPGQDCWTTECDADHPTTFDFSGDPIPADFFDPGSDPFTGSVQLGGTTGGNDTIVDRLDEMCFDDPLPAVAQTAIELVQLNLASCVPITVTYNGGQNPEQWNIYVGLAGAQQQGTLTATKSHDGGGTYTASLPVDAEFTFERVSDGQTAGPQPAPQATLTTVDPAPWLQTGDLSTCGGIGFFPGWDEHPNTGQPCCRPTCHAGPSPGHEHCTIPPDCPRCPEGCSYDNGPMLDDYGGPASQHAPDYPFGAGAADDFTIKDPTDNPCRITQVTTWVTHWNYDIVPNPPADYDGVNITIYANATPKGPGGQPEDDGSHSEYFLGGIVHTEFVPMALVTAVPYATACVPDVWQLDIPVSIDVEKNIKYWIEIQPVWDYGDGAGGEQIPGGQVAIMLSQENHDHPAQQIFPSAGIAAWQDISGNVGSDGTCNSLQPGSLKDLAFVLTAEKVQEKCAPIGDDCFTTLCDGTTYYDFGSNPIPADFFYPGSPPFTDAVNLGGPGGFPGDTIVRRLEEMCFPGPLPDTQGPINVEVTALNLTSCTPLNVDGVLFDMFVGLDPANPSLGDLTATKEDADGGTFTSNLNVNAVLTFVQVGGGPAGAPISAPVSLTMPQPGTWLQDCCDTGCGGTGFFPGWAIDPQGTQPCCNPTCHAGPTPDHPHCVWPPDCEPCPTVPTTQPPGPEPGGPPCTTDADCDAAGDRWQGAICVAGTCYIPKNRYLSIDATTNEARTPVAYQVTVTQASQRVCNVSRFVKCDVDGDCPGGETCVDKYDQTVIGTTWWLEAPVCKDYQGLPCNSGDAPPGGHPECLTDYPNLAITNCSAPNPAISNQDMMFGWHCALGPKNGGPPPARAWTESPVHVGDSVIAPVVTYTIAASDDDGASFGPALEIMTIRDPDGDWGDVVGTGAIGGPSPQDWYPPNRFNGAVDFTATIASYEQWDTGFPPYTWTDLDQNQIANTADMGAAIRAFEQNAAQTYCDDSICTTDPECPCP